MNQFSNILGQILQSFVQPREKQRARKGQRDLPAGDSSSLWPFISGSALLPPVTWYQSEESQNQHSSLYAIKGRLYRR